MDDLEESKPLLRTTSMYIHTLNVGRLVTYLRPLMLANLRENLREALCKIYCSSLHTLATTTGSPYLKPAVSRNTNGSPLYTSFCKPRSLFGEMASEHHHGIAGTVVSSWT